MAVTALDMAQSSNCDLKRPNMSQPAVRHCRTQDGVTLAYDTCGDAGPAVVLIHGTLECSNRIVN